MSHDQEFPFGAENPSSPSQASPRPSPPPAVAPRGRGQPDPEHAAALAEMDDDLLEREERASQLQVARAKSMTVEKALGIATRAQERVSAVQDKTNEGALKNAETPVALATHIEQMAKAGLALSGHHHAFMESLGQAQGQPLRKSGAEVAGEVVQTLIKEVGGVVKTAVGGPVGQALKGILGQMAGVQLDPAPEPGPRRRAAGGPAAGPRDPGPQREPGPEEEPDLEREAAPGQEEEREEAEAPEPPGPAPGPWPGAHAGKPQEVDSLVAVLIERLPDGLRKQAVDALSDPERRDRLQEVFMEEVLRGCG